MLKTRYYIYDNKEQAIARELIDGKAITDQLEAERLLLRMQLSANSWDRYCIKVLHPTK